MVNDTHARPGVLARACINPVAGVMLPLPAGAGSAGWLLVGPKLLHGCWLPATCCFLRMPQRCLHGLHSRSISADLHPTATSQSHQRSCS